MTKRRTTRRNAPNWCFRRPCLPKNGQDSGFPLTRMARQDSSIYADRPMAIDRRTALACAAIRAGIAPEGER